MTVAGVGREWVGWDGASDLSHKSDARVISVLRIKVTVSHYHDLRINCHCIIIFVCL